jgi:hypothetical protein
MRRPKILTIVFCLAGFLLAGAGYADVRTEFPSQNPGPPYYALFESLFIPHTDDWAAVAFVRPAECVPDNFNLLSQVDVPSAFSCPLTVDGFAIWKNGPAPIDLAPIQVHMRGLGAVPIWFVSWQEMQAALSDHSVTVSELLAMPSLQIGSAVFFEMTQQPGPLRPQGFGNGKIEINASGTLQNGRLFRYHVREMGVDTVSVLRSVRIEFK